MAQRKHPITFQQYEAARLSFEATPGNYAAAGRASGLDQRTAKKLWLAGVPGEEWGKPLREAQQKPLVAPESPPERQTTSSLPMGTPPVQVPAAKANVPVEAADELLRGLAGAGRMGVGMASILLRGGVDLAKALQGEVASLASRTLVVPTVDKKGNPYTPEQIAVNRQKAERTHLTFRLRITGGLAKAAKELVVLHKVVDEAVRQPPMVAPEPALEARMQELLSYRPSEGGADDDETVH